jgi:OPA family glycerol-3-phosphate transporter-like MFS transporter
MIPPFFKHTGRVSTVSGLLNACTYVGSALSTYGVALLSEQFDWSVTLWVWLGIAVMGTLVCLCTVKPWKRFVKENIPD